MPPLSIAGALGHTFLGFLAKIKRSIGCCQFDKQEAFAQAKDGKAEGNRLYNAGRYEDALLMYEFALQVVKGMSSAVELRSMCHANRATCYLKLGKYIETIKECTKALKLNPAYVKVLFRRGEAYEKLGRYNEAIDDMKRILNLEPSNDYATRNIIRLVSLAREKMATKRDVIGVKLEEMDNSVRALFRINLDDFEVFKDRSTGNYYAFNFNASTTKCSAKHEGTIKECTKALKLNPADVKALLRRGEAYEKLRRYDEAIADMKRILKLEPSNEQASTNIILLELLSRAKIEKVIEEIGKLEEEWGNSFQGFQGLCGMNFNFEPCNTVSYVHRNGRLTVCSVRVSCPY